MIGVSRPTQRPTWFWTALLETPGSPGRALDPRLRLHWEKSRAAGDRARRVRDRSVRTLVLDTLGPERQGDLAEVASLLAEQFVRAAEDDPDCKAALAEM